MRGFSGDRRREAHRHRFFHTTRRLPVAQRRELLLRRRQLVRQRRPTQLQLARLFFDPASLRRGEPKKLLVVLQRRPRRRSGADSAADSRLR